MQPPDAQHILHEGLPANADLWAKAGDAVIAHGPWAAAALLVFLAGLSIIWWVLKTSAKEVAAAREEVRNTNTRSSQAAEKTTEANTLMAERLNRVIEMLNSVLDLLRGGGRDVPPNNPKNGEVR